MKKIIILILLIFTIKLNNIYAEENLVNIYIFHSNTCPHCQKELKTLNKLQEKYKNIKIYKYEITNNKEIYNKVLNEYKIKTKAVPLTIIGDKYFIGYSEEKTKITFIKTISYYSKYGYNDRVAPLVNNKILPKYKIKDNQPTIDNYLKNYANHKLLFTNTKDISLENANILSTILTELNLYNILFIILITIIVIKINNPKDKLLILMLYISIYTLLNIFNLLNIQIINKISILLTINYLTYSLLLYIVKRKNTNLIYSITILISNISNYIKLNYYNKYTNILKELIQINYLQKYEYIIQILINILITIFTNILLIYFIYAIINKIKRKAK